MQPVCDTSHVDGRARGRGMAMNIEQSFLNDSQECTLHFKRQLIDDPVQTKLDVDSSAVSVSSNVLLESRI
jgi:hypothetical protein